MTPVTTRSFGNSRSGCYIDPSWPLTSQHVQANGIRVVAQLQLDDPRGTEGQVLGVPKLTMRDGLAHNVVFVCDMSNNVYAFDADTYRLLWKQKIGNPITITKRWDMWGINPFWGILSTSVINLTTGILYVVSASSHDGSMAKITYQLHSLRLTDGSNVVPPLTLDGASFQTPGSPVARLGDVPRKQRPALTLSGRQGVDTVFIAFGSFMESAPTNVGIVVAVDVSNVQAPAIAAVWATGGGKYPSAGIWQAGAGLSVDDRGYLHGLTGNGAFDPKNGYFGNCFFRLQYTPRNGSTPASLTCVDWWSPYSDAARAGDDPTQVTPSTEAPDDMDPQPTNAVNNTSNAHLVGDQDLGSGGALSLPASLTGYGKDVIVGGGKDGIFYVLDGNHLGQTLPGDFAPAKINGNWAKLLSPPWAATYSGLGLDLAPTQLDTLPSAVGGYTHHIHGQPVGYKSPDHGVMLFVQGENGTAQAVGLNRDYSLRWLGAGQEQASQGMRPPGGMPGGMLTLTCHHEADNTAVLWSLMPWYDSANQRVVAGRLVAYGANWINESSGQRTLIKLWDSADWGIDYRHAKFNILTPFNGRLFVPSYDGRILVFA